MQIVHDSANQAFLLLNEHDTIVGEITYDERGPGAICVPHTGVNPAYEGRGYAGQLLDALVEWALTQNLQVIPICPYVVRAFRKYPGKYADVTK